MRSSSDDRRGGDRGRRARQFLPTRQRGFTLVQTVIAVAVSAIVLGGIAAGFRLQANVLGQVLDDSTTFAPTSSALYRIRDELKSAAQNPDGLTALPAHAMSETSMTFRPVVGYVAPTDPDYAALKAAGRVSTNGILYEAYAKTIAYDPAARTVTIAIEGTPPPGAKPVEVIATDVESFRFFDGESRASPPAAPTLDTYVLGVRMVVRRRSAVPASAGASVDSSVGGEVLTTKVLIPPESLLNTKVKPVVGP